MSVEIVCCRGCTTMHPDVRPKGNKYWYSASRDAIAYRVTSRERID
jgi:hypothetical protein